MIVLAVQIFGLAMNFSISGTAGLLEDIVLKSPNKSRPRLNLGIAYLQKGYPDLAIGQLEIARELSHDHDEPSNEIAALVNIASIAIESGAAKPAEHFLDEAEKIKVTDSKRVDSRQIIISDRLLLYLRTGQYRKAIEYGEPLFEAHPTWASATGWYNLATAYNLAGDCDRAIETLKNSTAADRTLTFNQMPLCVK